MDCTGNGVGDRVRRSLFCRQVPPPTPSRMGITYGGALDGGVLILHVDFKKVYCHPVEFKNWLCHPVEFKKCPCPMSLSF